MISEHEAVHFEHKFKEACDERSPEVGKLSDLGERLRKAGSAATDLRKCIIGALLEAYEMGHASCKDSFQKDADARVQGVKDSLRRQVLALLDKP
jgi:hypothetical protein